MTENKGTTEVHSKIGAAAKHGNVLLRGTKVVCVLRWWEGRGSKDAAGPGIQIPGRKERHVNQHSSQAEQSTAAVD